MPYATLEKSGHKVHYFDTIETYSARGRDKPPLIMIHGLGSTQNFYMPVIPHVRGYRCIALDTYGAGRSRSNGEDLTLEQLAEDVVSLMDRLGIAWAVIVGHSMGGPMACAVAAAHPDRVSGVVCIGPVNPASVKREIFSERIDTVLKHGMEPLADFIPAGATNKNSTPLQRAFIRELVIGQDPRSYASHCRVIFNMKEPSGGFGSVKTPCLILAGDEDMSAPLEGCRYIHEKIGSAQKTLKVMEGVGHWHCIEAGDQVGKEIATFVSSL